MAFSCMDTNSDVSTTENIVFPFSQITFLSEVSLKGYAWKQSRHGRLILPCTPTESLKLVEAAATGLTGEHEGG